MKPHPSPNHVRTIIWQSIWGLYYCTLHIINKDADFEFHIIQKIPCLFAFWRPVGMSISMSVSLSVNYGITFISRIRIPFKQSKLNYNIVLFLPKLYLNSQINWHSVWSMTVFCMTSKSKWRYYSIYEATVVWRQFFPTVLTSQNRYPAFSSVTRVRPDRCHSHHHSNLLD